MSKVSRSPMRSLFIVPAVLMFAAAPALAQTGDEETTITVNHNSNTTTRSLGVSRAGLNLADGHDYARLQHRIADAADKVCTSDGLWNRFDNVEYNSCRNAAIAHAMSEVAPSAGGASQ